MNCLKLPGKFNISHSCFQREFSELSEPRPCPKRVTVALLEREEYSLDE